MPVRRAAAVLPLVLVTALLDAGIAANEVAHPMASSAEHLIVNGNPTVPSYQLPWIVAVMEKADADPYSATYCTGVLISPSHVLTAGHCALDAGGGGGLTPPFGDIDVAVGVLDLDEIKAGDRIGTSTTAHPGWAGEFGDPDLAILTLDTPIDDAMPLSIRPTTAVIGDDVLAFGWGAVNGGGSVYPDIAQVGSMMVTTDYSSTDSCVLDPGLVDHSHNFCFGSVGQAVCFGDSGGPIVATDPGEDNHWVSLVGVTSFGEADPCNTDGAEEVAERVFDNIAWIEAVTATTVTGDPMCVWNAYTAGDTPYPGWSIPCWDLPTPTSELPFIDVAAAAFYAEGVRWLHAGEITTGTTPVLYSPNDYLTRGSLAAFLWRFAGRVDASGVPFPDVTASWQLTPVAWLDEHGFTTGVGGLYLPDDIVTRAQLVTFLWRLVGSPEPAALPAFPDVPDDAWFTDAVAWAEENGITTGFPDGTFRPDEPVTRGQLATFLLRLALLNRM